MNKYVKALKQEIAWSKKNQKALSGTESRWFIEGLLQAIFIIKGMDKGLAPTPELTDQEGRER